MRKRSVAAVGSAVAALALWSGPAAQAHEMTYSWQPGCGVAGLQECGFAKVSTNHRTLTACDTNADGDGFWAEYKRSDGGSGYVKDTNGSASGCGSGTAPSGVTITSFRPVLNMGDGLLLVLPWRNVT